jgi:hypothetical protein
MFGSNLTGGWGKRPKGSKANQTKSNQIKPVRGRKEAKKAGGRQDKAEG